MTEKMIRDAYVRMRTIDNTIPDDVLDFMKDVAIEKINEVNKNSPKQDIGSIKDKILAAKLRAEYNMNTPPKDACPENKDRMLGRSWGLSEALELLTNNI